MTARTSSDAPRSIPFDPLTKSRSNLVAPAPEQNQGFIIDPDVSLPGSFSVKRVVRLNSFDIGSREPLTFKVEATEYAKELDLDGMPGGPYTFRRAKALSFWSRHATAAGFPASLVTGAVTEFMSSESPAEPTVTANAAKDSVSRQFVEIWRILRSFLQHLGTGDIQIPFVTSTGAFSAKSWTRDSAIDPAFYIIEEYRVSAFATKYGLGKTVKTFSLLPGEETTIKVRTWRQTESSSSAKSSQTSTSGSSIIDSVDQSAVDRFSDQLQNSVSDKSTRTSEEKWNVEGQVSGGVGFVSASVKAGGGGDYRSGQEDFVTRTTTAINEHTQQASATRKNVVETTSSTSSTFEVGRTDRTEDENVVERTLRNVNLRRVLNFVFRELNQRYDVLIHLTDVRIAFSTGEPSSWNVVAPGQLPLLVESVARVNPDRTLENGGRLDPSLPLGARVAGGILQSIARAVDLGGQLVDVLECVLETEDGVVVTSPPRWGRGFLLPTDLRQLDGPLSATGAEFDNYPVNVRVSYRFRHGPLNQSDQDDGQARVPGLVVRRTEAVMRTDSVVVEALLGFSDALDVFAFDAQRLTNEAREQANALQAAEQARIRTAITTLEEIADPKERAEAYERMFGSPNRPRASTHQD